MVCSVALLRSSLHALCAQRFSQVGADGSLAIPLSALLPLGGSAVVSVAVSDGLYSAARQVAIGTAATAAPYRPLQLLYGLDPAKHIIQQRKISPLLAGESVSVTVASDSKAEDFDSLQKVASLFATISRDNTITTEFGFLVKWSTLDEVGA